MMRLFIFGLAVAVVFALYAYGNNPARVVGLSFFYQKNHTSPKANIILIRTVYIDVDFTVDIDFAVDVDFTVDVDFAVDIDFAVDVDFDFAVPALLLSPRFGVLVPKRGDVEGGGHVSGRYGAEPRPQMN